MHDLAVYLGPLIFFAVVEPLLGPFQRVLTTEIMIWCMFAVAYNLLFGYTGLMSLGHALFFGAGMYGFAFSLIYLKTDIWISILLAFIGAATFSTLIGLIAVRVRGVYFLIITLILSMTFYAAALNYPEISGGSDGLILQIPHLNFLNFSLDIVDPTVNYYFVWVFLTLSYIFLIKLVDSPLGFVLKAIRENEQRTRLIGYNVDSFRLFAFAVSGTFSGLAGAMYAITFRFAGPQLMSVTGSVNVLVWTLVGGSATVMGPLVGTIVMVLAVEYISSETSGYLVFVGILLVLVTKFAPRGIVGTIRNRLATFGGSNSAKHERQTYSS
jgi:branched-chain amino acid transport system permease protein